VARSQLPGDPRSWIVLFSGLVLIFASMAVWIATGRETATFVGAGGTLIALSFTIDGGGKRGR
jgi:hypothetical protein